MKLHYDNLKNRWTVLFVFFGLLNFSAEAAVASWKSATEMAGIAMNRLEMSSMIISHASVAKQKAMTGTPVIELDQRGFDKARGKVGEKIEVGKVHVKAVDMPGEVTLTPSGSVDGIFTTDVKTLPAGSSETDITIYYEAKKIGKNEGRIYFMVGEDIYEEIRVKGLAIDMATPPAVSVEPQAPDEFKTEVGTPVTDTLLVNLVGLPSSVNVSLKQSEPGFTINNSFLYFSVPQHKLVVTFNPKNAGTFEATITFSNEFIEPVEVKVKGTATAKPEVKPEMEGDQLPLSKDNPLKLLKEGFETGVHNKPLSLNGWKNLVTVGTRAWWGYEFPDYDTENAGEFVAKVTAYDSKVEAGMEDYAQMLLVTPPLDYKASESKLFTFRVMGKQLQENMDASLFLCYVYELDGELQVELVEGVTMPNIPDQNGEWIDFHVDLSGQNIDDVFYMGFLFTGIRGTTCSAVYFIDDVSFGRTDLPLVTTSKPELNLKVSDDSPVVSDAVTVETKNLVEPVKLTLGGKDNKAFELSSKTVPVEGGAFALKYKGGVGNYEAYVKLTSRGAATKYVYVFVSPMTGLETVVTEENDQVQVFDVAGHKVCTVRGGELSSAMSTLPSGTYILRMTGAAGTHTKKITK